MTLSGAGSTGSNRSPPAVPHIKKFQIVESTLPFKFPSPPSRLSRRAPGLAGWGKEGSMRPVPPAIGRRRGCCRLAAPWHGIARLARHMQGPNARQVPAPPHRQLSYAADGNRQCPMPARCPRRRIRLVFIQSRRRRADPPSPAPRHAVRARARSALHVLKGRWAIKFRQKWGQSDHVQPGSAPCRQGAQKQERRGARAPATPARQGDGGGRGRIGRRALRGSGRVRHGGRGWRRLHACGPPRFDHAAFIALDLRWRRLHARGPPRAGGIPNIICHFVHAARPACSRPGFGRRQRA